MKLDFFGRKALPSMQHPEEPKRAAVATGLAVVGLVLLFLLWQLLQRRAKGALVEREREAYRRRALEAQRQELQEKALQATARREGCGIPAHPVTAGLVRRANAAASPERSSPGPFDEGPRQDSEEGGSGSPDEKRVRAAMSTGVLSCCRGIDESQMLMLAPSLRVLALNDQGLYDVPLLALPLPALTRARLAGNLLRELPAPLKLPRLEKLDVSRNQLASLPAHGWEALISLKELDLSNNKLAGVPPNLAAAPALRVLKLPHNQIAVLPAEWGGMRELSDLDVSHNRVEELPEALAGCAGLKRLNVEHNKLQHVPLSILRDSAVEKLSVAGNPVVLKQQEGFDEYLERMRRRVVVDGQAFTFSHKEAAHDREKWRRIKEEEM